MQGQDQVDGVVDRLLVVGLQCDLESGERGQCASDAGVAGLVIDAEGATAAG